MIGHLLILILNHARKSGPRPLPCPPKQDLTKLDLPTLQQIGLRDRRLEQNLGLPGPRPVLPIQTISIDLRETIYAVIPGTMLIITHHALKQKLCCWDISASLAKRLCWLDVKLRNTLKPPYFMEDGKYVFAVEVNLEDLGLSVSAICVDFRDRDEINMQVIFENAFMWGDWDQMFIDDQIIGVLICGYHDPQVLSCTAFNMTTHNSVTFTMETLSSGVECCYLFLQSLYIFVVANNRQVIVHHLPPDRLPYSHTQNSSRIQIGDSLNSDRVHPIDFYDLMQGVQAVLYTPRESSPAMPGYGAHAVTTGTVTGFTQKTSFCFWPVEVVLDRGREHSPLTFGPTGYDHVLDAQPIKFSVCATGTYVIMYGPKQEGWRRAEELCLRLLRFVRDPGPMVIARELELTPGSVDLSTVISVVMDDHLGQVFLLDSSRRLFCVAYA